MNITLVILIDAKKHPAGGPAIMVEQWSKVKDVDARPTLIRSISADGPMELMLTGASLIGFFSLAMMHFLPVSHQQGPSANPAGAVAEHLYIIQSVNMEPPR